MVNICTCSTRAKVRVFVTDGVDMVERRNSVRFLQVGDLGTGSSSNHRGITSPTHGLKREGKNKREDEILMSF